MILRILFDNVGGFEIIIHWVDKEEFLFMQRFQKKKKTFITIANTQIPDFLIILTHVSHILTFYKVLGHFDSTAAPVKVLVLINPMTCTLIAK